MNIKFKKYFKFLAGIIVRLGLKNPSIPHFIGNRLYRLKSVFHQNFENCPCDKDFFDYLVDSKINSSSIFHFGTGDHHHIGLRNAELKMNHLIYGVTAAVGEMQTYMDLVLRNPTLAHTYKVLFTDIYCLNSADLSKFNYINLFHLCEFLIADNAAEILYDDAGLIQIMIQHLKPNGYLVFYRNSAAREKAEHTIQSFVDKGLLIYSHTYKSLDFYQARITI